MKKAKWNESWFFDFAVEILFLIIVFLMPVIFDRRLGIVFSGTKIAWLRTLGVVILAVWAVKLILRKHSFVRTPLDWPVLSFLLCTTIATLTSVHVYTSFAGFYGRYEGLSTWYLFSLLFFVTANYIKSFEQLKRIVAAVLSGAVLMAIYSILQRHEMDPYLWGGVVTWQRVIGMIGQPNFLAAYMLMAFFLGLSLFLMEKKEVAREIDWYDQLSALGYFLAGPVIFLVMIYNLEAFNFMLWYFAFAVIALSALLFSFSFEKLHPRVLNVLLGISLLLIYVSILYTQSRGGYMGFFTGGVLFSALAGRRFLFSNWKKIAVLGFLIVLVSSVTMTRPQYSPFERFASEITTEKEKAEKEAETRLELKGAAGSRTETWKSAFKIIADYPFFGIGLEDLKMVFPRYETELFRFKEAFHVKQDRCHNEIFDVGVTKGLITFFVYLWLLFVFFRTGWIKTRIAGGSEKIMLAGLLAAALSYLIQNQFSFGVVAITSLFWIIWGMVMVAGEEKEAGEERGKKGVEWEDVPWIPAAAVLAVAVFLIYASFFSFRGDLWFKSGKTNLQMGRLPQAVSDFERSLRVFPFEGGTVSHLGMTYLNLSQMTPDKMKYLERAISMLKYGTRVDSYNADNFYMLSKIYLLLFDLGDRNALAQAENYAKKALKIDPYYAEVYQSLGIIFEKQGRFAEAALQFEKAFLINPELTDPMRSLENILQKTGRASEISGVFERALLKYPQNLIMLERVGKQYLGRGRPEKALALAEKMTRIDPRSASAYVLRGQAQAQLREREKAFLSLQQAVIVDPKNVPAHQELGRIYLEGGNREKAKEEFEQVLMLDPQNSFAREMVKKL